MSRAAPGQRHHYPLLEPVQMRWPDTDIYGHMNNAVHYTLFDTAVQNYLVREGLLDLGQSKTVFLVVSSGCSYFEEITFGDRLDAGIRIDRLGRSSVTYEISLFRNEGVSAAATGHFTHVNVGRVDRRPIELSDRARDVLARLKG